MKKQIKNPVIWLIISGLINVSHILPAAAGISGREKRELQITHEAYQDEPVAVPEELTGLDKVLLYGGMRNAGLKAAFYRWKASVHEIAQARSLPDPEVSFETYLGKGEMYAAGQAIPFIPKLYYQSGAAAARARQFHADFLKEKLRLFYEIKDAYYEYWFLHKRIQLMEETLGLLSHFESVAQSKFRAGQTRNQDLLKAQVELGRTENELLTLRDYRGPVIARLNALLNRAQDSPFGIPERADHPPADLNEEEVFALFTGSNPDLKRSAYRIDEARKKLRLARLSYVPDLMIGAAHERMDTMAGRENRTSLEFKVNIPLWPAKQKGRTREAGSMREAAEAESLQIEQDLTALIRLNLFKIRNAKRQILLYRDALIPKADQSLKASETAYTAGDVDFQYLIDSERTRLEFQLAYYQAMRDYEQNLAELEMTVGQSLRG